MALCITLMVPYSSIDLHAPFSAAFLDHGAAGWLWGWWLGVGGWVAAPVPRRGLDWAGSTHGPALP